MFNELSVFKNRYKFNTDQARNWVDAYILFLIVKHLQPLSVLEIGYYEGFSFGIMLEAAGDDCIFTSCDITYKHDQLSQLISIPKTVNFVQCESTLLGLDKLYDFIMIDGKHEYHPVIDELNLCYPHLSDSGLMMIDDYTEQRYPGVYRAITEFIQDHKMVQLLKGHQQIVFGKQSIDTALKNKIIQDSNFLVNWSDDAELAYVAKHEFVLKTFPDIVKILKK